VVLSNGQLFVGLDENGLVHDFYYPYVGLDNLTNARSLWHKIGVWVDGSFSWTDSGNWQTSVNFSADGLIGSVRWSSSTLGVSIETQDFVDSESNTFIRCMNVTNLTDKSHDVRVFMHQIFQISRAGRADTAMYVPDDHYILDYKGRCCLLIGGVFRDGGSFDQYAVGNYGIEGKDGTFRDAEDGVLSGNAVEHSDVDSVIRFQRNLLGRQSCQIDYWVVAADSQSDAQAIHLALKTTGVDNRYERTKTYWENWLKPALATANRLEGRQATELKKSLLIIKAHCDARGSILASGDSSIFNYGRDYYCYCWPRDAAYAIWPMMRVGLFEEAKRFFDFARDTMHPDGYLMHKYQPDRAIGSTWHPLLHNKARELAIQEDETAIVLFMLGEYFRMSRDKTYIETIFNSFIKPCADFMTNFVDAATGLPHASYDLWEQLFVTSTYTTCTVIAGLETAANLAEVINQAQSDAELWRQAAQSMRGKLSQLYHPSGYFRKGLLVQPDGSIQYDDKLDISNLYGPFMFAKLALDDERLVNTLQAVERGLLNTSPIGGVVRDEHDSYFLSKIQYAGNPWAVCTLWLAQVYNALGNTEDAGKLLGWALDRAYPSGALSEQFDPETGLALSVAPLVWSHAEFINTTLDMLKVADQQQRTK